ncbi:hypothetical protein DEU56DRAFT_916815 [Suillus clintonianus]|uniref:uncharacterized protein n=1 Tax=Suillus clintonianus TaxID=1904413 RepID=UPI001B870047|nr:uncharacterized protein DEU56DRAFT_916815 [Suillus clintonianus]KAG2124874.1 hypothetical protein DEU56DRAFT_916815 [Suillus clintonianus]
MTQFKADHFAASANQACLPPISMDSSLAVPLSSLEYVHEQLGGGCRQSLPPELTPTRLRSRIRATSWDAGIVKEASIRRAHQQPSRHSPAPSGHSPPLSGAATSSSFLDDGPTSIDTSSLPMPLPCSRQGLPYLGEPILRLPSHPASDHDTASLTLSALNEQHSSPSGGDRNSQEPAQIQDMFYGHSMNAQPAWIGPNKPHPFDSMANGVKNLPSHSHNPTLCDASRLVPPLYVIPPTPSKDIHDGIDQSAPKAAIPQLDLSYYPDDGSSHSCFPEESVFDDNANSQKPSLMGRRSLEMNTLLEEGFAGIERAFDDLSLSTTYPLQQLTNMFLKSRGRAVHGINYWNIYANYFKENMDKEVAHVTEDDVNDAKGKGKGKEVCRPDMQGTPSTRLRTRCYEKFKDTFPDAYQDILDMFDEAAVLGAATQTVSQRGQSFQRLCKKVTGILDSSAARFGFEAAVVLCGKIVNQDASLGHVHTTPGAGGFFETRCRANDDTIIAHIKPHVFNAASLSAVEASFNVDDDNQGIESSLRDDTSDVQIVEGQEVALKWLKCELTRQVECCGGKFASDKNFPWKLMPNALADDRLRITGYPAHKCLLLGEYHSNTSKSKAIGGLMHKEISALVDALKAGIMVVVNVPAKLQAALIASEVPVIVGEAPPSDYLHPGARRMFADATRVKKAQIGHNARPSSHDEVPSSRPFVVVTKPPPHPAPPPSRPFVMATKPVMLDVISFSTSDSEEAPLKNGKGKKRKLKLPAASRTAKRHAPSAVNDKKGETRGGPLSPLTVRSSSDEPLTPAAQPAKRLRDGPVNRSHYVEGCAPRKLYHKVDSEGAYDTNKKDPAIELAVNTPARPVMVAPTSDDPSVLTHTSQTEPLNTVVDQVGPASPHTAEQQSPRPMASQNPLRSDPRDPLDSRELLRLRDHPHRHYSREPRNVTYNRREAPGLTPPEVHDAYGSYVSGFAPWNDVDDRQHFTPYSNNPLRPWGYRDRYGQWRRYPDTQQMVHDGEFGDYSREALAPRMYPFEDHRATRTDDNHDGNSMMHEHSPNVQPGPSSF